MSWFDLVVGAGIAATAYSGGAGVGFRAGRRKERTQINKAPELMCSCEHGFGSHENSCKCHGETKRANKWDKDFGSARGWEYAPCPCVAYASIMSWKPPALPPTK